jgi:HD-GYP domain-containing protein (c-di-GMP phosphodiesterase class II)
MRLFRTLLLAVLVATAVPTGILGALLVHARGGVDAVFVAAAVGSLLVAVALSALVARSFSAPIAACVRGALEIARGRFGREVPVHAGNELGDLAYTFNHMSRELASYDAENHRLIAALEHGYLETIRSLASAIDAKDPYTRGHSDRVAALAVEIGRELGLGDDEARALEYAGILHDVGKIAVPDAVLTKRGKLDDAEMALVRGHPAAGAEIVKGVAFLEAAAPAIRWHHERWDGRGYPDRLAGEAIPLIARIVNAADTWDACTSDRPYQRAITAAEAARVLAELRGTQLEPRVHDALVAVLRRRGTLPGAAPTAA